MPTYTELMRGFEFGPWSVIPERGLIRDGDDEHKIEPLVMDVFVVLASHGGEVVTKDQLIVEVWDGRPQTDDVITRCISALRRGLRDDARHPEYIETVQRRGYRVMLPVLQPDVTPVVEVSGDRSVRPDMVMIAVGFLAVVAIAWFALIEPPPESTVPTDVETIAVFPFDCLQDARESGEHLCFGFAEEAISSLKRVEGMQIIRKRNAFESVDAVAEDSIVTGSVQIIADQVKIAAQLENARSGVVVWSETFDADRDSIFTMQREVADGLRGALDPDFSGAASERGGPTSYAAAEAYALGRYLFEKRDHNSIVEAIAQFEEAIRLDPSYGPAWMGLAYTYSIWPDYDLSIDRWATFDRALEIIADGVEADPGIRQAAGTVYGYIYHKQNKWTEAMTNTTMAVSVDSPEADAYHWHSRVLASVGRLAESQEYARLGAELDPDYPALMSRLAIASFWVDDLDNAARYFEIANRMDFGASINSLAHALYLIRIGEFERAKARAVKGLQDNNVDSSWVDPVFDGIGNPQQRSEAISIVEQIAAADVMPANVLMTLWVLLEEPSRAMAVARSADQPGSLFELEIIYIDEFRAFRQLPEFRQFVDEVGLADYWDGAGCSWVDDKVRCPGS